MKVLITGGAGFIGSYVAKELIERGDQVIVYDNYVNYIDPLESSYGKYLQIRLKELKGKATMVRGDIRYKSHLLRTFNEFLPDKVIHLAALPIATLSNKYSEAAMEVNMFGTINVLEMMRECKFIKQCVMASSSMVYGNFISDSADENHPTAPIDVYGGTKLADEIMTRVFSKQYSLNCTIVRPSAVYGPTDSNKRVSQIFVENALKGEPLILHNGGSSKLDFTYVKDIAHGFVLTLDTEKALNETFNITYGHARSLKEFAEVLQTLIPNLKVQSIPAPKDEKRPERGTLNIDKARRLLKYEPKFPLEKGLKEYVEFVKKEL